MSLPLGEQAGGKSEGKGRGPGNGGDMAKGVGRRALYGRDLLVTCCRALHTGSGRQELLTVLFTGLLDGGGGGGEGGVGGGEVGKVDSPDEVSGDNIKPKLEQGEDGVTGGLLDVGGGGGKGGVGGGEEGEVDSPVICRETGQEHPVGSIGCQLWEPLVLGPCPIPDHHLPRHPGQ